MKKSLLTLTLIVFFLKQTINLSGVPAYPHPIDYKQPDGTIITIQLKGDEKINWAETLDGYTILVTEELFYEYAVIDENGDLSFSGVRVSEAEKRSEKEATLLKDLPKGLFFSERQVEMMRSVWDMKNDASQKSFPTTGDRKMLCILMQTTDKPFTKTQSEFNALFNQLNYTTGGASGSVKDYYLENSYGQLNLTVDVVGPYTAQHEMAHYGSTWAGARELATEAVHLANPHVNYANYDNSDNGWVDGIYMIFAGYGEEAGGGPNTIWSHAWSINPVQLDGKWISRYACSPELRGNSGTNITRIGVIGHEFGHILGAPDYYDTDGASSGGSFTGTGRWDMMAGGSWNNGGATPAHHNAYTKTQIYNWAKPTLLNLPQNVTLQNVSQYSNSYYRINSQTPGEYYLLENRHKINFDQHIPGEGLIIYHVHNTVTSAGNSLNVGHPQKMYVVCAGAETDPTGTPASYGNINSDQATFPGSTGQTYFSDYSKPSSISWQGRLTNKPLTNISTNSANKTVSFDFMQDVDEKHEWLHLDDGSTINPVGISGAGIFQIAKRFDQDDLEDFRGFKISKVRVYIGNRPLKSTVKIWQGDDSSNLQEVFEKPFSPPLNRWIIVELDTLLTINPDKELWIGLEYEVSASQNKPASTDFATDHDGKGNMIRFDINDKNGWQALSEHNIIGDWNLQAWVEYHGYKMEVESYPEEAGTANAEPNADIYASDDEITLTASPEEGYKFLNWRIDGAIFCSENPLILTMPEKDINVVAHFTEEVTDLYTVTLDANPVEGGEVTGAGNTFENDILKIIAAPAKGYEFVNWTGDTDYIDDENSDTTLLTMPADDVDITANFALIDYELDINVDPEEAGTITVSPDQNYYNINATVTLEAIAGEGYEFVSWSGDIEYLDDENDQTTVLTMPDDNIALTANFALANYELLIEIDPPGAGTINISPEKDYYNMNDVIAIEAVPEQGYIFDSWSGPTGYLDYNTDSIINVLNMPAGNTTLTANFVEEGLMVEDIAAGKIFIFPNPARDRINVTSQYEITSIRLINISGQVISEIPVNKSHHEINVSNLRTGVYFLQIHTHHNVITKRVQIAR